MVKLAPVKPTTDTTDAEPESSTDTLPMPEEQSSATPLLEFVPIDEASGWCSNCGDRLVYDHMAGIPVCPIQDKRCPRHQG